jgi:hypothetical protein
MRQKALFDDAILKQLIEYTTGFKSRQTGNIENVLERDHSIYPGEHKTSSRIEVSPDDLLGGNGVDWDVIE